VIAEPTTALEEARERTLAIVAPFDDAAVEAVHNPIMSPLVWDLGHIAAYEDLWLCHRHGGLPLLHPELAAMYDAFETPRDVRGDMELLDRSQALEYLAEVRERSLSVVDGDGDLVELVLRHEHQHNETMLQAIELAALGVAPGMPRAHLPRSPGGYTGLEALDVPGGPCVIGAGPHGFAYDNERPRHEVELPAFRIDRAPVTNAAFAEFVADGGYGRRELWSEAGWGFRERERWERPLYWSADGGVRRFDRTVALEPELPVMHVSWFEAEAFARWRGARLPSEQEWEKAARLAGGERGNLDQLDFGPGPAGPFIGDCWEWTASDFRGYPGFSAYPYREYSEVFFGSGYRVLRGASWATRPRVARATFRNWDHPQRRQIFAGFRCAEDVR
jgi:gamma-glutamyl hercynylcysteine S-oxide synthase